MKILVVPDLHANPFFLKKVENLGFENFDKIIFLGDYFDSRIEEFQVRENVLKISDKLNDLNNKWGDKIVWLLGNHEIAYLFSRKKRYMLDYVVGGVDLGVYGWDNFEAFDLLNIKDKISFVFLQNDFIFSHAGVKASLFSEIKRFSGVPAFSALDEMEKDEAMHLIEKFCCVGSHRGGHFLSSGGLFWIDYEGEFLSSYPIGVNEPEGSFQLAGHTAKDYTRSSFGSLCLDMKQKAVGIVDTESKEIIVMGHKNDHRFYVEPENPYKIVLQKW